MFASQKVQLQNRLSHQSCILHTFHVREVRSELYSVRLDAILSSHRLDRSSATPVTWDRSRTFLSSGTQSEEQTLSRGGRVCKYHGHIFYPLVPFACTQQRTYAGSLCSARASLRAFLPPYFIRCRFIPHRDTTPDRRGPPRIIIIAYRRLGIPAP